MNDLIRFRCTRCNSSLKVAGGKAGSRVACPKCGLELTIPESSAADPGGRSPADEGLRADAAPAYAPEGGTFAVPTGPEPIAAPAPFSAAGAAPPGAGFLNLDLRLDDPPSARNPRAAETKMVLPPTTPSAPAQPQAAATPAVPLPIPAVSAEARPVAIAPTSGETASIRGERGSLRTRDVVMPRAAVVAYSTFAILALLFAFLAGLMIGHFLWSSAPPAA
ncbi:MAG: hypothetical protein U0800_06120 [Isosphaeraceae bacterium]